MWFAFNRLPKKLESCHARVHIGGRTCLENDPYDAIANSGLILPREQKVLELFLKLAKPLKTKGEFSIDHVAFGTLLPFCAAIPFEILGVGVISFAKQNARITATLKEAATKY